MRLHSYARISRDDPPGVERLEVQHRDNRARIAELGAECAGEFEDDGVTGYLDERWRPGLAAVLASWRNGDSQGVVARDVDRFARNSALLGHIWTLARQAGAKVISRLDDLENRHTRNAKSQAGEEYRERVRETCMAKFAIRAQEHQYCGGRSVFGTRWIRTVDDSTALQMRLRRQPIPYRREIIPEDAARLVRAIEMVECGGSVRAAAAAIGVLQNRLAVALRNPGIAGAHCYGRTRTIPDTPLRTSRGATPLIDWGAHPAIIPRARWERLQERLDGITVSSGWASRPGRASVPLSGQLVCGVCGARVEIYASPRPRGRVYRYCRCTGAGCVRAEVSRWPAPILAAVADYLASPVLADSISKGFARAQQPTAPRRGGDVAKLQRREATILDLAGDGTISADEARRRLAPLRAEMELLRSAVLHDRGNVRVLTTEEIRSSLLLAVARLRDGSGTDADLRSRLFWVLRAVRVMGAKSAVLVPAWGGILPVLHDSTAQTHRLIDTVKLSVPWEMVLVATHRVMDCRKNILSTTTP